MKECRCYDHIAGELGVRIADSLHRNKHLATGDDGLKLTPSGIAWFEGLGIDATTPAKNRPQLRTCLDWTERRPHLAGALAARLADYLLDADWLRRRSPGQRGLAITPHGTLAFDTLLG